MNTTTLDRGGWAICGMTFEVRPVRDRHGWSRRIYDTYQEAAEAALVMLNKRRDIVFNMMKNLSVEYSELDQMKKRLEAANG